MRRKPTRRRLPKLITASRKRKTRKRKIRRRKGKRRKILPAFPNKDRRQRDGKKHKRSEKGLFRSFCAFPLPNRVTSGPRYGAARERLRGAVSRSNACLRAQRRIDVL